jgi:hypothetical protein
MRPTLIFTIRPLHPSLLDQRLMGDPWIIPQEADRLDLCFDDFRMASLSGTALDLPTLNLLLDRMRHRAPRRRRR